MGVGPAICERDVEGVQKVVSSEDPDGSDSGNTKPSGGGIRGGIGGRGGGGDSALCKGGGGDKSRNEWHLESDRASPRPYSKGLREASLSTTVDDTLVLQSRCSLEDSLCA